MNSNQLLRALDSYFRQWKNRILLAIGRGILLAVNDSGDIQKTQITLLQGEVKDQVESMAHFGFSSNPPENCDVVMLSVGGNREHGIIIATESREKRFKNLNKGDSVLYNSSGKYLHLKENNIEALVSKLKISNDNNELITVLSDFMDKVITGKVITAIGPQTWTADTITALTSEKEKLDTFKI